jgi:xanthine dehydrogenase accessory factor
VRIDPQAATLSELRSRLGQEIPLILIDGRMTKKPPETSPNQVALLIGLGPGFIAGSNCHAVVETNRGLRMGQVIWNGPAEQDTGIPEKVVMHGAERVLRAPTDGFLTAHANIGDRLEEGQMIAEVGGVPIRSPFKGVLRGLLHPGTQVRRDLKIGDVDPRDDPRSCFWVSDKSLAVGGGVLEAILSRPELRPHLWD